MDWLSTIDKDIFSQSDRKEIKHHLLAMKCDPVKIDGFIWFLERDELHNMKYAVLLHYDGDLKKAVYQVNTKTKGNYCLERKDIEDLLKNIEKVIGLLDYFHLITDKDRNFTLSPFYRNFYESAIFHNLAGKTSEKIKAVYPLLSDLQPMLKQAIKLSTFTKRGRTPKEFGTDFTYHIVHLFYMYFKKLPSATTRNSHFEQIVEICYRTLNIETTDLSKTIFKAILRYKKQLSL